MLYCCDSMVLFGLEYVGYEKYFATELPFCSKEDMEKLFPNVKRFDTMTIKEIKRTMFKEFSLIHISIVDLLKNGFLMHRLRNYIIGITLYSMLSMLKCSSKLLE